MVYFSTKTYVRHLVCYEIAWYTCSIENHLLKEIILHD